MKKKLMWLLVVLIVVGAGYIRLAPSDPEFWHVAPQVQADQDLEGGVLRVVETGPDGLARLDAIARETSRTTVLAGSVEDGMITYVTRSLVFGFPDYTTVQQDGDVLRIHGRLRFGESDLGVNRERVDGWLALL
ncbi:DUF1499 domain-containing protein [Ruegeria halocynthiae]|uniref:DUF1499 domain-containing protein n=1 Tax=Ruegeria halocynthiae TaxID=985054 RepID=UPI000567A685|nr:DUF1499 domain-containing protein [Ruegeria halocynthiae]